MIKNKIILLTGATGGIGSEIARLLSKQGTRLILVDLNAEKLAELATEIKSGEQNTIECFAADLSIDEERTSLHKLITDKFQSLDVLINCAGINTFAMFENIQPQQIEKMISVNITSPILLTQKLLPLIRQSQQGQIINFGSTFGSIAYPGFATYSATKFAIRGFTEALRRELAKTGINVSYIAPRATKTKLNTGPVNDMNKALGVSMDAPELVALEVINILKKGHSTISYLGWPEKLFVRINSIIPKLVDNALIKQLDTIIHFANQH